MHASRRTVAWLPGITLLALLVFVLSPVRLMAAEQDALIPDDGFYFGAELQWERISPATFNADLGVNAAVFGGRFHFPFTLDDETALTRQLNQLSAQQALAVITLNPSLPLTEITPGMADDAASRLAATSTRFGVPVLVRFAPEMNGSWTSWGQQPAAYVAAFRMVAEAVHHRAPQAAMVWSPVIATGYPFASGEHAAQAGTSEYQALDTDGDGELTAQDDPYAPYYPGDDVVDWVGLRYLYWGNTYPYGENALPEPSAFSSAIHGQTAGLTVDFSAVYADQRGKPLLLETAALYNPAASSADATAAGIKQAWLEQVLADVDAGGLQSLKLLLWFDYIEPEVEIGGGNVDWSVTNESDVARVIAGTLRQSSADLGPVSIVGAPTADLNTRSIVWGVILIGFAVLAVMVLLGVFAPDRIGGRYQERSDGRDLRIDFLRGVAMVFVVVDHIDMPSLFHLVSQERIGVVSGAELFVFFSGGVLGLVYRRRIEREGWVEAAPRIFRRAGTLYVSAVVVSLAAYALSYAPRADASMLTTWTDKSTSVVYRLYPDPAQTDLFVRSVAFLRSGPSQFNIMGLYVVLLLLAPLLLFVAAAPGFKPPGITSAVTVGRLWERRRLALPILLGLSWSLYILQQVRPVTIFNAQFEAPFPLLAWQVLFVNGLVAGYYRSEIITWFRTGVGRIVLFACVALAALGMFFAWNNPYLESDWDVRLSIIPVDTFTRVYQGWFERAQLQPGRVLNTFCAIIALYLFLTICWNPMNRLLGWLLIPIGAASLYVFIWQVFFSMIVANIALFQRERVLINTLGHLVVLLVVWIMIKKQFLFNLIPR